jgi:hypothetical protein
MICEEASEKAEKEIARIQTELPLLDKENQETDRLIEGMVRQLPLFEAPITNEYLQPYLNELFEKKKIIHERKQELEEQLSAQKEEILYPEDIRGMISTLGAQFNQMEDTDKQKVLKLLVKQVELYQDRIRVEMYAYKQQNPNELIKKVRQGSQRTNWLPRLGSRRTLFIVFAVNLKEVC